MLDWKFSPKILIFQGVMCLLLDRCVSVVITFGTVPYKIFHIAEVERGELLLTFSRHIHEQIFTFWKSTQIKKIKGYLVQRGAFCYWCLLQQWRHSAQLCPGTSMLSEPPCEMGRLRWSCWGPSCWKSSEEERKQMMAREVKRQGREGESGGLGTDGHSRGIV